MKEGFSCLFCRQFEKEEEGIQRIFQLNAANKPCQLKLKVSASRNFVITLNRRESSHHSTPIGARHLHLHSLLLSQLFSFCFLFCFSCTRYYNYSILHICVYMFDLCAAALGVLKGNVRLLVYLRWILRVVFLEVKIRFRCVVCSWLARSFARAHFPSLLFSICLAI